MDPHGCQREWEIALNIIMHPSVRRGTSDSGDGLFSGGLIKKGSTLIHIPPRSVLSLAGFKCGEFGKRLVRGVYIHPGVHLHAPKHTFLALALLEQKNGGWFSAWIQTLPVLVPLPFFCAADVLARELAGSPLLDTITGQKEQLDSDFASIRRALLGVMPFSLDDFKWARSVVSSRVFSIGEDCGMIPVGDLFNHSVQPNCRYTRWL
jgi:hypothetical protein